LVSSPASAAIASSSDGLSIVESFSSGSPDSSD